jgi:bifunctional non-homologous end joining protein LigD
LKWDSYRVAVHIEPSGVRFHARRHDWTDRFPAIAAEAKRLPVSTAILGWNLYTSLMLYSA